MNNVIFHKKGDKISIPISSNIQYKVLTNNGYEIPKAKEEHLYAGPILEFIMDDDINTSIRAIPEHEFLIFKDKLIEKKAKDIVIGDIFEDINKKHIKIKDIKREDYDGKVYSFIMPSRNYYVNGYLTKNCCRLRLDLSELTKKNGSVFGAGENTGSIGVVTLNMPKIGYLSHTEEELFSRIDAIMSLAKDSLELKRKQLNEWFDAGLFPYTKRYLKAKYENHFSTIGLVGMNELCRNYFRNIKKKDWDISTKEGLLLSEKILKFMKQKCSDLQVETGHLYNLESTPAESTCYRLAKHDKLKYPDILTAGSIQRPYYTNSSNLPVGFSENPWDSIKHQEVLQQIYTGGTTFHTFLNESIQDWKKIKSFIKKVMYNTKLPYITISPTFSFCGIHGYLNGDTGGVCPKCKEEALKNYNEKLSELKLKKEQLTNNSTNNIQEGVKTDGTI